MAPIPQHKVLNHFMYILHSIGLENISMLHSQLLSMLYKLTMSLDCS